LFYIALPTLLGVAVDVDACDLGTQGMEPQCIGKLEIANHVRDDLSARAHILSGDEVENLGLAFNDMAEKLQRVHGELEEARNAAETANRAKSSFLANMSHEIRTPLNAIIGYSEMLEEEAVDFGYQGLILDLRKIQSAGRHLLGLLSNILDLSKIEAGKMELSIESFDLPNFISDVAATMRPVVEKNGNRFAVNIDATIGIMTADITRLRQIVINLLGNAGKFTENGMVAMDVSQKTINGRDHACIRISDSGIGISADQLRGIFMDFNQGDATLKRKYDGTGLGLSISRRFCQMMGGSISVESELQKGTTFTAQIPLTVAATVESKAEAPRQLRYAFPADEDDNVDRLSCIRHSRQLCG
jgi:signal transduction histidine kinase